MNLRDDEIAYLESEGRCKCGHLNALHADDEGFCRVDNSRHHFCSEADRERHLALQTQMRGNPAVRQPFPCRECEREGGQ